MAVLPDISTTIAAIAALGTASAALVDASKSIAGGSSNLGFVFIRRTIHRFMPAAEGGSDILEILRGNWINGMPLSDQKAVAKSMLKLRLSRATAARFAQLTHVEARPLQEAAQAVAAGEALSTQQSNALGRFDLYLSALMDEGYQRADQRYRTGNKALSVPVSMGLALLGGWSMNTGQGSYWFTPDMSQALLVGLIAIPLAPISKDLTSALAAGVKALQGLRRP
jgi:hypothetical protein